MPHTGLVAAESRVGSRTIAGLINELADSPGPRYRALSSAISSLLLDGRLGAGTRLPSERALATELAISRATATAAYEELAAQGLLQRRRGSGSYLMLPAASRVAGPGSRVTRGPRGAEVIDLSIAALPGLPGVIEAAAAQLLPELGRYALHDGYQPYGIEPLRVAVAQRYADRGVPTTAEHILITNGAQHGFDLILRATLNAGDRVLVEQPTYPGALDSIRAHHGRPVPAPIGRDGGWDPAAIANALRQTSPRLAYLIPDFHNPTGFLADTDSRQRVAAAARRAGTPLVIDESFVDLDLRPAGSTVPTPMAATSANVFSLGSMSKAVWGGLRVGWIRADPDSIARLAVIRARADMGGAVIEQLMAVRLLAQLEELIAERRHALREQRDVLLAALGRQLPAWRTLEPAGGLSAWVELDAPGATPLTHLLEQRAVLINSGSRFAVDASQERFLRIPFALAPAELLRAVTVMAQAWTDLADGRLAPPSRPGSLITA
ncbi:MAG: transcriptional regulator GntR family/aspartate aminotransferase [Frankiales bacterium]|nr:transcriptional regulator GntR family/aspartate aminotransferase [Frankiales bacterium]